MNNEPLYGNNIEALSAEIHRLQNEVRYLQAQVLKQKHDYCVEREEIIASIGYRATFAAMAMQGMLAHNGGITSDGDAQMAVDLADALIKQLAVPK